MRLVFAVFYIPALLMDIHQAVSDFIVQGGELLSRLRSYEGEMLSDADLHLLRVELHLLDGEAAHLQRESQVRPKKSA
jgi:hypothetical protein